MMSFEIKTAWKAQGRQGNTRRNNSIPRWQESRRNAEDNQKMDQSHL